MTTRRIIHIAAFAALLLPIGAQTAGQYRLDKKKSGTGFADELVTPAANSIFTWNGSTVPTAVALSTLEPAITAGTTAQYWRGDKSWQTLSVGPLISAGTNVSFTGTGTAADPYVISASGGGGGGLTNWTEAVTTATPNATIPVVSLAATNAASNADVAILPKGAGAILAQIPDNTSTGGNKRGQGAVDFQTTRTAATQIAGGSMSAIMAGAKNTIGASSGNSFIGAGEENNVAQKWSAIVTGYGNTLSTSTSYSFIGGGNGNSSAMAYSFIGGGAGNSITTNTHASILGGDSNTASGDRSSVLGGLSNTASGAYSVASGAYATTRGIRGMAAHASAGPSGVGSAQAGFYVLSRLTTDATTTEASTSGSAAAAATRIVLPNNYAYSFRGQAVARSSGGDVKSWVISGTIKRGANAASTALVGTPSIVSTDADTAAAAWAVSIDADGTNGSLRVQVTGEASTTIRWVIEIRTVETG